MWKWGRCLVAFAKHLNVVDKKAEFEAIDGYHFATIDTEGIVSLQMIDVDKVDVENTYTFLNTGSPHHIEFVENVRNVNVKEKGASIRYSDLYGKQGSNVNFVSPLENDKFAVRTYERGVEDETLSCGTGVTAVAIALFENKKVFQNEVAMQVEGGELKVKFEEDNGTYKNVFLIGPAKFVFKGEIEIASY